MADDSTKNEDEQNPEDEDFGALTGEDTFSMGSLPPLSDFDSAEADEEGDSDAESDLPPLDTPEASGGDDSEDEGDDSFSGLPPIVDIRVDTPAVRPSDLDTPEPSRADADKDQQDTGADETPSPAGFETPGDDMDSPEEAGFGFQDFAADSDFSPETPEVGPGPDSDIETPMFDSAFGGDSDEFSSGGASSQPTQAMETPMFGSEGEESGGDFGFDEGAFGATPDEATPAPDFSPDTGAGVTPDTGDMTPAATAPPARKGSRLVAGLVMLLVLIGGVAGGMFLGAMMSGTIPFLPNPYAEDLEAKDRTIEQQRRQIADLTAQTPDEAPLSPEEIDALIQRRNDLQQQLNQTTEDVEQAREKLNTLNNRLALVRADIEQRNNEFVEAQEALEDLRNETAITDARHQGLLAENERLTEMVGELEVANARRQATKDALLHNTELLIVQIQGGSPLTPARYDYQERLARAEALRDKIARAKWVDPQLLDEYTSLYLAELGIASSREYFYARIPVEDDLGNVNMKWAECLMNGNWSVYFRTIDGRDVGSYENVAGSGPPQYEFREDLPSGVRSDIVEAIEAARPEDWRDKIEVLRAKSEIFEPRSDLQRKYGSL